MASYSSHRRSAVRVVDVGDASSQLADAVAVDREPEAGLGLDLVALGDGDLAHVVAEPRDPQVPGLVRARGRARPRPDAGLDTLVLPVPHDDLPRVPQTRDDVGELAIAVRGLVEVHEVHVDLGPRQVPTGLGVQMEERLAEGLEPGDPHLGRRERVHPRDDADARIVALRVQARAPDAIGALHDERAVDADRDRRRGREAGHDRPGLLLDAREGLLAVQVLAAREELQMKPVGQHGPVSVASSPCRRAARTRRNRVYANVCSLVKPRSLSSCR